MGRLPALLLVLLCGAAGPGRGGAPRLLRFSGQVPENSPAGTRVRGLRVPLRRLLGPGEPPGEWALEGDGASRFSLQRRPGGGRGLLLLRTAERLDREAQPEYGLRLRRRRAGRSPREALLRVRVLDRNDHRPRLPPARPLEVDELAPLGTEVARLRASDGDEGANARLTYRPWPPGAGSRLLFVVPRSGQVLAVGSLLGLRRLRLCVAAHDHGRPRPLRSPPRCLGLAVRGRRAAGAGGRRRRWAPSLPPPERPPGPGSRRYTARLPPGARVGDTVFTVPPSRDRAAGGWFELASPGASPVGVDRASGRLYLRRELRAGGRAEVLVKVHRGGGRDNDWYLCHVTLLAPEEELLSWGMYPYPYLARVDPDARKGTLVYQLVAYYSNNENTSAGVTYTLIAGGEERFRVDKDTGVIMTTGLPLTWNKEYVVTVEATNEYGNKSPYASISILVGARPPQFTNMSYSVFVPENTPAGEKVAVVEAVSFQSQPLSYTLLTNPSGLFRVRQESGELSLTHPVDYESEHHLYHLLLKATEVESTLSSVTEVMVHITDENDCSPEFQHSIYSRDDIPETIPVGTSLLQVLATDCDSGSNSEITYFIQSTDFSITRHGVINSNQRLNFERANHMYEFVVIAVDKGHPPRTGTASVRIRMANVNDEAPVFSQPIYRTFISEDAGPSTLVATVRAKDPDGDGLLYLITGGNEEGNFELDSQKGIIKLRRNPPPNLKGPQYTLNITAIDDNASGGPTPLSSFAEVIVGVNDINNNKPVFRECTYYSDSTWVLENQPPGTYVLQVEAYDADLGVNGEVKYGLMHRDGASLGFSIDPDTGVITTTQSFDREKQREYTLSVTATDQAQEPLIGVCQITVLIADVNDNDPKFENSRYQYFLSEDTPVGMSFLRVAAHDSDQGVNAAVTYSVLEHQLEYFQINPSTGWVYVNRLLSQTTRISCYIVATDGGNRSSTVELTVTVTNALSRPPQWEQSRYWVTIPENTTRDTKIVTIKATSPLGDPRVTYNLEEGQVPETNMPVRFYLKPNRADGSASLLVAEPLDFETTKFFTLTVRAQNVAMTPLASFTTVCVNITDVNDNVPFFVSSNYEVSVPEGADVGKSVVQVLATDLDSGLHGEVHYLILKDASKDYQFFTIEPKTGIISTHASFDREKRASYLIEVQSQDSSESARPGVHGQPNTDTAYVRIFVSDVNDNTPAFPQSVYEVSIDEDRDVGSPVVTATAVDEDEGILPTTVLGQVHAPDDDDWDRKIYQFEGKTSRYFILNDNSGLLAIKEGTPPGTYNIRVRVIDGVWPDVVSTVKVIVKDIKDDALRNAGSIQIKDITPEEFISQSPEKQSKYYQMKKLLSEIVSVQLENVHIFSVLNSTSQTQGVDVWFAVYGPPYYKAEKLNGNVAASRVWLENILDINITQIGIDECMTANCTQSSGCISKHEQSHVPTITTAGSISLVSVTVLSHALCGCAARESPHLSCSSYQTNPCLHGGTCVDTDLGYRCKCSANFHGPDCQQTKHSFRGHGYAWFPPLKPCFENRISLEFITEVADGLLLYHGPVARGQPREREDFIALELSGGIPSLTVSHSSGELFLQLSRKVNVADRRWHNIKIINDGKAMKLILDHCVNISVRDNDSVIKKISQMDLSACEASGETVGSQSMGRLFSGHQPLQLGGVKKILPYHNSQRHFRGFVGCIRNVIVDSKVYDLEHPAESLNSAPGCALTDKMCQSGGMASCGAHGKCVGGWDFFRCDCSPGYAGPACEKVLPEWAFGRDSWIHYEPRSILSTQSTQIQLMVRTRISHSTLLSLASADGNGYIRLEVAEGFFSVNFSLGDKNHSVRMRTLRINNGQWVLLTMERYNNEFTLRVNSGGGDQEVTSVLGANRWFEMDWASVVLGNRLPNHSESDFQGCMRDVQLNGQPLLVEGKSTEFGLILRRQGVTMGCHSSACSSQPCYSPFLCVDLWRKYECRCPAGKVEVTDNLTGLRHCTSSPCGHWTCRNGGTCVAQSQDKTICQCPEGYKGRWCEISQVKAGRPVGLSSGSILAISMCLLVFLALLVSYTVWSQWGSSGFRKGGIYHIPEERESWEDVRENVFNYNEEGGGERDQNAYDIDELKKPLHTIPHFSLRSAAPHSRTPTGPKRDSLPKHGHQKQSTSAVTSVPDFKEYVSQIIWNADNDLQSLPADTIHFYCLEGQCSLAGSLSSLDSISGDEDLNYDCLQEWGSKFDKLKELYKVSNEHL
ncbi:neural-cadherin-like isoform 6-T6 [Theristicus caerulescens]